MRLILLSAVLFGLPIAAMPQTNNPPQKSGAEVMRELRLKILTTSAAEIKLKPDKDFPRVFTALMDWPIGTNIISVYGARTGDASIYTTSTFGVIGGIEHASVRVAAQEFVKRAETVYDDAVPTKDFPYPKPGQIHFYLVCFDGVRMITTDEDSLRDSKGKYSALGKAAQNLITELRILSEKKQ